jgi:hypothetical protein
MVTGASWRIVGALVEIRVPTAPQAHPVDRALRPIFPPTAARIEAPIFVAFLAYGLYVPWPQRVRALAPGLSRRAVMEKMSALPRVDVGLPTTDGRPLILPRSTQAGTASRTPTTRQCRVTIVKNWMLQAH